MLHYVLIRHGETVWTKERRYQGQANTQLTARGKKQVARFVREVTVYAPDVIFSSSLDRCKESARLLCAPLNKRPKVDARLNELSFGDWEGKTADELLTANDPTYEQWAKGKIVKPKGGESIASLQKRVKSFIRDCQANYDDRKIVIVTHGGPIRMFLKELLQLPEASLSQFRIDPGTMSIVAVYQYSRQLVLLNSTAAKKGVVPCGCS